MVRALIALCSGLVAIGALFSSAAAAEADRAITKRPGDWAIQAGDFANNRYSPLDQINSGNAGRLQPVWSFSTGVLRGHEGGPLVIGDVMYLVTPFPNIVYALDLNADGRILWKYEPKQDPDAIAAMCCDTVNRGLAFADGKIFLNQADTTLVALDAATGKMVWSAVNGDPKNGETATATVLPVKDKIIVGISGGEFGVRCHLSAYDIASGKLVWRAFAEGPDESLLVDPDRTTQLGKPIGREFEPEKLARRSMEDRRRLRVGLDVLRSRPEPDLLRHRQSLDLEPGPAPRRQQMGDEHFRPRPGQRHGEMGLPDDPP